jgi:uncharacterized membrane protein
VKPRDFKDLDSLFASLRQFALSIGLALVAASGAARAQPAEDTAPASTPQRPVVMPMTPGSELREQTKPARSKPRIVSAPGAATTEAPAKPIPGVGNLQPDRPQRNAKSDYTFCNRTSYALSIAVGIRNGGLLATRGWWIVPAGECRVVIKGELKQPTFYTFARSSFAHSGAIRTWGGTQTLCTGKGTFQATSDGSNQCGPGYEAQGFARVDTEGKTAWTTTLAETPGFKSLDQARIAGVQRLLADLGRFEGAIDGVPGPKFVEALGQVRTALGLPSNDATGLYNKLLAEAAKNQAGAGLTFCNRTQDIIWSALGIESQGKKRSMGWWRLQPGQCEKVIKDRLIERYVYAFAAADRTEGVAETWGGTKQFCTRDATFEIDDATDCQGRSFKSTGFLEIDTGGRPGLTFEFAARREEPAPQ